ncbi:MAG TPA: hypothetical protein VFZ65_15350 [Planctomycetota bacterium]|nr:hypothetical protein [Planctomycetota bacterium]
MGRRRLGVLALLTLVVLPACATTNGVRWAYGMPSVYDKPDEFSESVACRAIFGVPVIVGGAVADAVTWPLQLLFGVWPTWGSDSTQMDPRTN